MPLNLDYIRHFRTLDVTLSSWNAPGTTVPLTTSYTGTEVDCSGFGSGVFMCQVTSNSGWGHPPCYLQQRINTTDWMTFATIHPDFTTTENDRLEAVDFDGDFLRTMIPPTATTTVMCSFAVIGKLKGA